MKNILLAAITVILATIIHFSCTTTIDKDFKTLSDKIKTKTPDDGGSGGTCPVGTWVAPACSSGGPNQIFSLDGKGKGYFSNPDCKGICTPLVFKFNYTISGNTINYSFYATEVTKCTGYQDSSPNVPTGNYSITFTCNGDGTMTTKASTGTVTYTRR